MKQAGQQMATRLGGGVLVEFTQVLSIAQSTVQQQLSMCTLCQGMHGY
jgi:hypothetical protein